MREVGPKLILERFSPEGFPSWEWRKGVREEGKHNGGETDKDTGEDKEVKTLYPVITAGKTADGYNNIPRNITCFCYDLNTLKICR